MGAGERDRLRVPGRRVDTGAPQPLLLVYQADGSWVVEGLQSAVRLEPDVMVTVCESVLGRARRQGGTR
jgi:hypothetical protein